MIKHQHPIIVLIKLYHLIRYSVIPISLFIYNEIKHDFGGQPEWVYLFAAFITVLICLWSFLAWKKSTYSISPTSLEIQFGVFTVTRRAIPLDKITGVTLSQNWVYRLLRVVKIEVHSADSNWGADAEIVTYKQIAMELEGLLAKYVNENQIIRPSYYEKLSSKKELFMMSISSSTFWLGVPLVSTILTYSLDWYEKRIPGQDIILRKLFDSEMWKQLFTAESVLILSGFITIASVLAWLISLVVMQIKYHGWKVIRKHHQITIQYGLYEKKIIQIHTEKIQAIRIKERWISRFYGYVSVWIDCIGLDGEQRVNLLIPSIRKSELNVVVSHLLYEFKLNSDLHPLHKGAKHYFIGPCLLFLFLIVPLTLLIDLLFLWVVPLVLGLLLYVYSRHKNTKWGTYENQLIISKDGIRKTTVYVLRKAVESVTIDQNRFQKFLNISRLKVDIDSPRQGIDFEIMGIDNDNVLKWYKNN